MPPKVKFSREEIAESAFQMVREEGMGALSARSLASRLGTSTAPVFTAFENIDDLKNSVKQRAVEKYGEYFKEAFTEAIPFKGVGMKYIQFAKEEPWLFKLLFMDYDVKDTVNGYHPGDTYYSNTIVKTICKNYGLDEKNAMWLYNHLSVYTHGFAVMFANGNSMFTLEEASEMISEMFKSLSGKVGIK